MRRRIALVAVLLGMVAAPATAAAQNTVVARDRCAILSGQALGGTIVYHRGATAAAGSCSRSCGRRSRPSTT